MLPGISTACLYPHDLKASLRELTSRPMVATEIFINTFSELEEPFLKELRKIADDAGTKILSVHPFTCGLEPMLFFSQYPQRFVDGIELYKKYFNAAGILGANLVVFHGNYRATPIAREEYFRRYRELMDSAATFGVEICHENVQRCAGYDPGFFADMRNALPDAGFVLDIKQTIRSDIEVADMVKAMGPNIRHIHVSDHDKNSDCLPVGKGQLKTGELVDAVAKYGFNGGIIVELYRENFSDIVELYGSYQQLLHYMSI